jgi:hypothetical protein
MEVLRFSPDARGSSGVDESPAALSHMSLVNSLRWFRLGNAACPRMTNHLYWRSRGRGCPETHSLSVRLGGRPCMSPLTVGDHHHPEGFVCQVSGVLTAKRSMPRGFYVNGA